MIRSVTFEETSYNELPYKFEAGTPHIAGAIGLGTAIYENVSILPHYENFVRGVIELSSALYFSGVSFVFLWTCALVLERNRG